MIQKTIKISNFLLIFAAVYFSVNCFYQFIEVKLDHSDMIIPSDKPVVTATVKKPLPQLSDYNSISDRNLFQTEKEIISEPVVSKVDIDSLKQTDLSLKLWGTVSTDKEVSDQARAVIEETKSGYQTIYKVGDQIQNAILIGIFRNSVILDVNGKTEKLIIEEEKIATYIEPSIPENNTPATLPEVPEGTVSLKRSQINDALKNLNQIMTDVRIEPVFKDGKPDGVMLANIETSSILKKMGLRIGDIITGINGQKIDSMDNALVFYESLSSGEKMSLQLKRRGRPTTMDFIIE